VRSGFRGPAGARLLSAAIAPKFCAGSDAGQGILLPVFQKGSAIIEGTVAWYVDAQTGAVGREAHWLRTA
jgi:hypothetical protein